MPSYEIGISTKCGEHEYYKIYSDTNHLIRILKILCDILGKLDYQPLQVI